jgi:hypothetical protein
MRSSGGRKTHPPRVPLIGSINCMTIDHPIPETISGRSVGAVSSVESRSEIGTYRLGDSLEAEM